MLKTQYVALFPDNRKIKCYRKTFRKPTNVQYFHIYTKDKNQIVKIFANHRF